MVEPDKLFNIKDEYKNIGIRFSGGADSTLVLFLALLLKKKDHKVIVIHTVINNRPEILLEGVKEIIKVIEQKTKYNISELIVNSASDLNVASHFIEDLFLSRAVDLIVSGVTAIPDKDFKYYSMIPEYQRKSRGKISTKYTYFKSVDGYVKHKDLFGQSPNSFYSPLRTINKKVTTNVDTHSIAKILH